MKTRSCRMTGRRGLKGETADRVPKQSVYYYPVKFSNLHTFQAVVRILKPDWLIVNGKGEVAHG